MRSNSLQTLSRFQIFKNIQHSGILPIISKRIQQYNYQNRQSNDDISTTIPKCYAAAGILAAASVTTQAGYTMSPLLLTTLSTAPLVAFGCIQVAGFAPIKQIWQEKQTGDLSPFPFVSLFTNCSIWTLYGLLLNDQTLIVANGIGASFGIGYTLFFTKYTHMSMLPYYSGSLGLLGIILSSPIWLGIENGTQLLGLAGSTGAFLVVASPLGVVRTVMQKKTTKGILPFPISLAMTFTACSWFSYGWFVLNDPYIWFPNIFGMGAGLLQLSLFVVY
eukprot:149152_1